MGGCGHVLGFRAELRRLRCRARHSWFHRGWSSARHGTFGRGYAWSRTGRCWRPSQAALGADVARFSIYPGFTREGNSPSGLACSIRRRRSLARLAVSGCGRCIRSRVVLTSPAPGLLARGIAEIGTRGGLNSWRWIFVIEGLMVRMRIPAVWACLDWPWLTPSDGRRGLCRVLHST